MTVHAVITGGFGTFGSPALVITDGYTSTEPARTQFGVFGGLFNSGHFNAPIDLIGIRISMDLDDSSVLIMDLDDSSIINMILEDSQ